MNRYIDDYSKKYSNKEYPNLKKRKTSINLSKQSKKTIKDTIQILYQLSKPKTVRISKTKTINNYRCSFITLTLPSKQIHTDIEIKKCLNAFLTNIRKVYGLQNYVWVSEIQKNGNLHFHMVIDKYINHHAIRYYWNKSINKLGYIDRYKEKFNRLSLKEYADVRKLKVEDCKKAYAFGKKTNWNSPSTEQVVSILSPQKLSGYLAKYLSKGNKKVDDTSERAKTWGKSWSRSQSLSKIKLVTRWNWSNVKEVLESFEDHKKMFYKKKYEWAEIWYFNFKKLNKEFKEFLKTIFNEIGYSYNYTPG